MVLIERYGNQLLEQMSKQLHLIGTAVTVLKPHYGQMVLNTIMISITGQSPQTSLHSQGVGYHLHLPSVRGKKLRIWKT